MKTLAGNAVVAEVAEDIGEVGQAVILSTEAQVAVLVEPGRHGRAVGHQHPLPDVKLPARLNAWLHACIEYQTRSATLHTTYVPLEQCVQACVGPGFLALLLLWIC